MSNNPRSGDHEPRGDGYKQLGRRHKAKACGWTPGSGLAQAVLGPLEPTPGAVRHWLEAQVLRGQPFTLTPELGAFLLRELERGNTDAA